MSSKPLPQKPSPEAKISVPRRRRFGWLWLVLLLVVFLPSLLSITGQIPGALGLIQPQLARTVRFQSGTMHWWSPVRLTDVAVRDVTADVPTDGVAIPLATVAAISTSQPLWKLVLSGGRKAEFTIIDPVVNLRPVDDSTNIELTLNRIFGPSRPSDDQSPFPVVINIENGTLRLLNNAPASVSGAETTSLTTATTSATLTGITARLSTLETTSLLPELLLTANVEGAEQLARRSLGLNSSNVNPRIAATLDQITADFALQPITDAQMVELSTSDNGPSIRVEMKATDKAEERQLIIEGRRLSLSELQPLIDRILPGTKCAGKVSCLIQGRMLGTSVDDGIAGRMRFLGENILWRNSTWAAGEKLALESFTGQGAVAFARDGLLVNELTIRSAIFDADGEGEVRVAAPDPVQVLQEAASSQSTEQKRVMAEAKAASAGQIRLNGRVDVAAISRMLPLTLGVSSDVQLKSADIRFSCRLQRDVDTASLVESLTAADESISWQLAAESSTIKAVKNGQSIEIPSPLRADGDGSITPSSLTLQRAKLSGAFGDLSTECVNNVHSVRGTVSPRQLWNDLRAILDLPEPRMQGNVEVTADVVVEQAGYLVTGLDLSSEGLKVHSDRLQIRPAEPLLQMLHGTASVEGNTGALKTVVAPWCTLDWLSDHSAINAQIDANPQSHVQLQAVIRSSQNTAIGPSGMRPVSSGGRTIAISQTTSADDGFQITEGRVDAHLVASDKSGTYAIERGRVEIPGIASDVTGTLTLQTGIPVVNLAADTNYDLARVLQFTMPSTTSNVMLVGKGRELITLQGAPSLWTEADVAAHLQHWADTAEPGTSADSDLRPLTCSGKVAWASGRVFGLPVGPGTAVVQMKDGLFRTEPIQCALGAGELVAMPQWDLSTNRVQLASGSRVHGVEFTPELCKEWLGYVSPMMSEATSVEGKFSARVHRFDYFPDRPAQSTIQAVLTIHTASASPGPSLSAMIQAFELVRRKQSLSGRQMDFPKQDVSFELRDGMIMHDGLAAVVADYHVRSSGGVGLNRQVKLVLDVPLEKSVEPGSRPRAVRIPVAGTVSRPIIDTSGLVQNLGSQQVSERVNETLDKGLNRLLDKIR